MEAGTSVQYLVAARLLPAAMKRAEFCLFMDVPPFVKHCDRRTTDRSPYTRARPRREPRSVQVRFGTGVAVAAFVRFNLGMDCALT